MVAERFDLPDCGHHSRDEGVVDRSTEYPKGRRILSVDSQKLVDAAQYSTQCPRPCDSKGGIIPHLLEHHVPERFGLVPSQRGCLPCVWITLPHRRDAALNEHGVRQHVLLGTLAEGGNLGRLLVAPLLGDLLCFCLLYRNRSAPVTQGRQHRPGFLSGRTRDPHAHPPSHQAGHFFQIGRHHGERCLWHRWTSVRKRIAHSLQMAELDGRKLWRKAKLNASGPDPRPTPVQADISPLRGE